MPQATGGDVGVDALIAAGLGVVLAPVALIHRHQIRQCTGRDRDVLQHGLQVLDIRRLVAHPHRHDHLLVAVHRNLVVVAVQIGPTGLHEMAVRIREVALGLPGWRAIGLPGLASPGHRPQPPAAQGPAGGSTPAFSAASIAWSRAAWALD